MALDGRIYQVIPVSVWFKRDSVKGYWSFKVEVNGALSLISIIYDIESPSITDQLTLIAISDTIAKEALAHVSTLTKRLYNIEVLMPQ